MATTEERLGILESNQETLFTRFDELKEDIKDIRRLTIAVEKIAFKVDNINDKVSTIDDRLSAVEKEPIDNYKKAKQTTITTVISSIVSAVVGALIAWFVK